MWDKVYTAEQATKGKVEYDMSCSGCHVKDLSGRDGGGEGPGTRRSRVHEEVGSPESQPAVHRDQDAHAAQPARFAQ